jgi:predicted thioesterase
MSETLQPGLTVTRRIDIDRERTISFMGDECRVYATPKLLYDIEMACRDLLLQHIEPGKDSVGTRVELDHLGATLLGMWVEITVTLTAVNGGAVSFEFSARDAVRKLARGKHNRFIVGIEKTAQRLKRKARWRRLTQVGSPGSDTPQRALERLPATYCRKSALIRCACSALAKAWRARRRGSSMMPPIVPTFALTTPASGNARTSPGTPATAPPMKSINTVGNDASGCCDRPSAA